MGIKQNISNTKLNMDLDDLDFLPRPQNVFSKTFSATIYDIYLDGVIEDPSKYRDLYRVFNNASDRDMIRLHINSRGGRLDAGMQIINHMIQCPAKIIGVIHTECASMATAIALACDDWELNDYSTMMVHSCSYGSYGKQSDVLSQVEHVTKFNKVWIEKTYKNFLTDEEIKRVLRGEDIYIDQFSEGDTLETRLQRFLEERESEDQPTEEVVEEVVVEEVVRPARKRQSKPKSKKQ